MTKTDVASFSIYNLDTDLVQHKFAKVGNAIVNRNYRQAVDFASKTLVMIQEQLVFTVLDHRAHALAMQGQFDQAVKDAQDMIACKPTLAASHLRLGEIYRMQGKQMKAIDAFDTGLQLVSKDDPDYAQLVDGTVSATEQSEARVDFVARLPVEIVDDIISLLPNESRSVSLIVSSAWRRKIFKCSNTWKTLTSNDDTGSDRITSAILHIAGHVEDLTIESTNRRVFLRYLFGMSAGNFSKIKSLTLSANATKHINTIMIMSITSAFWQMHSSLTKLVLHLNQSCPQIPLLDLLSICSNLSSLEYSTAIQLSTVIGEVKPAKFNNSLVDLQLKAMLITGQDLRRLLPHCQQLRRLILYGSDNTALDIVDTICPNLEIVGHNPDIKRVKKLNPSDTKRSSPGLYQFYTKNGGAPEPASTCLQLIRRNMHSLKTLYINISAEYSPLNLAILYSNLKLENLEELTFWGDDTGIIQPLILRSISTCTTLTNVHALCSRDMPALVDALVALPQLRLFGLSHTNSTVGETELLRLLEVYARNSRSEQRRLTTISLRFCENIVTDNVLAALAGIDTLEDITLEGLPAVSVKGVNELFKKLGSSVSKVKLTEMDAVTDSSLTAIGSNVKGLKGIHLGKLKNVSDSGIIQLIDQVPRLESLTIVNCKYVTQNAIAHAKKKIKDVVITA